MHIFTDVNEEYYDYSLSKVLGWISPSAFDLKALADALDCQKDFCGVGIIYNDGGNSFMVCPPSPGNGLIKNKATHIIITEIPLELSDNVKKIIHHIHINARFIP